MLSSITVKVKESTKRINVNRSVPQGYKTSPILFNVFINDLLNKLAKIRGIKIYAYADDLAILVENRYQLINAIKII